MAVITSPREPPPSTSLRRTSVISRTSDTTITIAIQTVLLGVLVRLVVLLPILVDLVTTLVMLVAARVGVVRATVAVLLAVLNALAVRLAPAISVAALGVRLPRRLVLLLCYRPS